MQTIRHKIFNHLAVGARTEASINSALWNPEGYRAKQHTSKAIGTILRDMLAAGEIVREKVRKAGDERKVYYYSRGVAVLTDKPRAIKVKFRPNPTLVYVDLHFRMVHVKAA
jgi:hypothetical protein